MRFRCVLALAAVAAIPAHAATWIIDPSASRIAFFGEQTGQPFTGHFTSFAGVVTLDPSHPEDGHLDVTVDVASATTGDAQRDSALPQAEWLNANLFPRATFHAPTIRAKGGDAYEAVGTLTIRDVSAPITLPFTLTITDANATAHGTVQLVRTRFGVGQGPWANADWVGINVTVSIDVVAKKQ